MPVKNNYRKFFMKKIIALVLIIVGFYLGFTLGSQQKNTGVDEMAQNVATSTVSIVLNKEMGFASVFPKTEFVAGENLFNVLDRLTKANRIEFTYKDYGGSMGIFISSIASTTGTSDKWWQYWVNGEYANIGVSSYKPKAGDVVEFRLTGQLQ
jgi:hypothetical protein